MQRYTLFVASKTRVEAVPMIFVFDIAVDGT